MRIYTTWSHFKGYVVCVAREVVDEVRLGRKNINAWQNDEVAHGAAKKKKAYMRILNGNVKADKYKKCKSVQKE